MLKSFNYLFVVLFISCGVLLKGQSMQWVVLTAGTGNGSCTSISDCSNNILCYGLEYTPSVTGTLTSYTTGFFLDCVAAANPITSNSSCVMADNSDAIVDCGNSGIVLFRSSGNSGTIGITDGTPLILHQVCFSLAENQSANIIEDETTDLTLSVDLSGGGATSEFPSFTAFEINHNVVCDALAVDLLSFNVTAEDETVTLNWVTSTEKDNDFFAIEWSPDGRTFLEIGQQAGNGTTSSASVYNFRHQKPVSGLNYYRLKAVEFDGDAEYSEIKTAYFSDKTSTFNVFPNPAKDHLFININQALTAEVYAISIWTISGQFIMKTTQQIGNQGLFLSLDGILPGSYIVKTEGDGQNFVARFVKS